MFGVVMAATVQVAAALATIAQGSDSRITEARQVAIRSSDEWQALWKDHSPQAEPPVDFSSSIVVGVFLGSRPTAGYRVDIISVTIESATAVVEYRERRPEPGALLAQIVTSPYHLVRIPGSPAKIEFRTPATSGPPSSPNVPRSPRNR